ncbi:histidine kinase [Malaciobacter canalis]|uniref:histidine kinase n=1 Tax=Malaciobacter canalis TaxID=1912871 RepID=A0ABX4LLJ2_9BACT|nr:PAS domain-containing sensor histidine kinase [Malaciobacter canalis]PHO08651.1 histidine kinase [Malaciobacter canalis]QEE32832.1 PAS sensor-containing two-component system histidine kinase [Malaciobacter canalis]
MKKHLDNDSENINTILNSTIEGILIIKQGFIVNANDALVQILEYKTKDELIGNLATGVLIPSTTQKFLEFNKHLFQEVTLVSNNGDLIPAIIKISDIKLSGEKYKIVSLIDLREIKKNENLLFRQSKLASLGEMISMIAHQWRQPLASVGSIMAKLRFKTKKNSLIKNEDLLKDILSVQGYLKYMSKTIDDFANFFKDDKQKEYIDIIETTMHAKELIQPSLEIANINLEINKIDIEKIYTYKNEYIQIILNLINNSIDAITEREIKKGKIDINFVKSENYLRIKVSDNAKGIPQDIINRVFDPYFSTKHEKNGTGLGLYMCKVILEKHFSGTIDVKNTSQGTCFSIDIKI